MMRSIFFNDFFFFFVFRFLTFPPGTQQIDQLIKFVMPTRMKLGKNLLNIKQKHINYLMYIEKETKLPVTQTADV